MKKSTTILFSLIFMALSPILAQDEASMAAPKALDHEFFAFLVGEWEGTSESPMGKTNDLFTYKMGLNDQFLMQDATIEMPEMSYQGTGYLTLTPEGAVVGNWIDNFRNMFKGTGMIEGNIMTVTWESPRGTSTRITEKLGDDQMKVIGREETPQGTVESVGTYTRKTAMGKK